MIDSAATIAPSVLADAVSGADAPRRERVALLGVSGVAETLPFTVRLVRTGRDLERAAAVRHAAYARHVPEFAAKLRAPEAADFADGVAVLLAESKLDGSALGTMRIQTNQHGPLGLEQSVTLPPELARAGLAEVTRLGVLGDSMGNLVKTTLVKASFQYCQLMGVDWAVIAARAPLDRQYLRLMFEDVFPGGDYLPMRHANDLPHRVLAFNIHTGETRWAQAGHPLLRFFCQTHHPDIDLRGADVPDTDQGAGNRAVRADALERRH